MSAVDRDVEEIGGHRGVVVPDVVMHKLIVPATLPRLHVQGNETSAEEIVARTMAAVFIHQWHSDRYVHEAELRVGGVRCPRIVLSNAIAADFRALGPGLRPEFAG